MTIALSPCRDAALLARLHATSFAERWEEAAFAALLTQAGVAAAIAGPPGEPAQGFILVRSVADEAEILTLAVPPAARRRGVGRALVSCGAGLAYRAGAGQMFLEVGIDNVAAKALYSGLGFVQAGYRRGYYRNDGGVREDALILRVALPLTPGSTHNVGEIVQYSQMRCKP